MPVSVIWSAVIEDDHKPTVKRHETMLFAAFVPPAEDVAAQVLLWWLEDVSNTFAPTNWDEYAGEDGTDLSATVVIHEPAELAGCYSIQCERKITARGYTADESDKKRVVPLIEAADAA